MKSFRRELSIDEGIHRGIIKSNQITSFPLFYMGMERTGMPCKTEIVFTELPIESSPFVYFDSAHLFWTLTDREPLLIRPGLRPEPLTAIGALTALCSRRPCAPTAPAAPVAPAGGPPDGGAQGEVTPGSELQGLRTRE